ncbi:DUF2442 domain-containing protein [Leptospira weilii]|uniref:DUF2442 domain-containing protein n=1 Tax=Leptospira weilii TaxID=28184 RepID=UPI0007736CDB|nr:DUF2442 domain-containing protein [Leptospira weilii]
MIFSIHEVNAQEVRGSSLGCSLWRKKTFGPFAYFPRLLHSTAEQRSKVIISGIGLHWDEIEEDVSVKWTSFWELEIKPKNLHVRGSYIFVNSDSYSSSS